MPEGTTGCSKNLTRRGTKRSKGFGTPCYFQDVFIYIFQATHPTDQESELWGSRPPTRSHTPSTRPHSPPTRSHTPSTRPHTPQSHPHSPTSVQSTQEKQLPDQTLAQDIKPFIDHNSQDIKPFSDHFLAFGPAAAAAAAAAARVPGSSLPPTRSSSPVSSAAAAGSQQHPARTPPPKRWKRSFDMTRGSSDDLADEAANDGFGAPCPAKRFCGPTKHSGGSVADGNQRFAEADSAVTNGSRRFAEPRPMTSYPHSMPASPTMLDSR